jgi:hypothetical protein
MATVNGIVPFDAFLQSLEQAQASDIKALASRGDEGRQAFEKFRSYLLTRYSGVEVPHSFVDDAGQIIDCIPIDQQPSRKSRAGEPLKTPPQIPAGAGHSDRQPAGDPAPSQLPSLLSQGAHDTYGNARQCPVGTVPVVRTTLEQLAKYRDLNEFFRKAPDGGRLPSDVVRDLRANTSQHRYAHALQPVANIGGASILNIWMPPITGDQVFSLSQQWYVGGTDAATQTVECGLQVFPGKYNTGFPVLFIYYTSADYADGSGCYNLDCDAFTQTSSAVVIGGAFTQTSQPGGQQFEAKLSYVFDGTAWWLVYQDQPVGYYSLSLFNGGALSNGAERVDFGGETVGESSFPPMGSGAFPDQGFGYASYHRNIQFFPPQGGIADATLLPQEPSPGCYRLMLLNNSGTSWGTHFFFGGPGGVGC